MNVLRGSRDNYSFPSASPDLATRPPRLKAKPMAGRWQAGLKNMSAALDVAVLLKTIRVVLMGKGK